jgi:hypothetical protein
MIEFEPLTRIFRIIMLNSSRKTGDEMSKV